MKVSQRNAFFESSQSLFAVIVFKYDFVITLNALLDFWATVSSDFV